MRTGEQVARTPDVDLRARVLIVDDSIVARSVLSRIVEGAGFQVAASVGHSRTALDFLERETVDIVLLDLEMPDVNGLAALPDLVRVADGARIMVVSSTCDEGGATAVQALALGAADTLVKPGSNGFVGRFADVLRERLERLLDPERTLPETVGDISLGPSAVRDFDIVAIGASTGGIHAIARVLRALPTDFTLPILITQHLPDSFMSYFAAQLAMIANRSCDIARDGLRITPGRIIVAPGDGHLRVVSTSQGAAIRIDHERASSGCMPSVDPMFTSVAKVYGERALAVVLSGMGRDGSVGAGDIRAASGTVVVQDRESSVIWGMPGRTAALGHANAVLSPEGIGQLIARRRKPR